MLSLLSRSLFVGLDLLGLDVIAFIHSVTITIYEKDQREKRREILPSLRLRLKIRGSLPDPPSIPIWARSHQVVGTGNVCGNHTDISRLFSFFFFLLLLLVILGGDVAVEKKNDGVYSISRSNRLSSWKIHDLCLPS